MAELFLEELEPEFISRPTSPDLGYDFLVGFLNERRGINTIAIEVKSTERTPAGRIPIARHTFDRIAHSNIPGLLLVADVKQNQMYYAWLKAGERTGTANVSVPLVEVDDASKALLRKQVRATEAIVSAAG